MVRGLAQDTASCSEYPRMLIYTTSPSHTQQQQRPFSFSSCYRVHCTYVKSVPGMPFGGDATTKVGSHGFCALCSMCTSTSTGPFPPSAGTSCIYPLPFSCHFWVYPACRAAHLHCGLCIVASTPLLTSLPLLSTLLPTVSYTHTHTRIPL
uniref:Uncharacterized protein n=1 Tax=Leishmania guyanensis TaxID=5670 RepID=A0A1E1J9J4_LEIGU|nr:Hypothetical protein BN36_NA76390 [Leishmania guyanensis]CCM43466.1 Hypothetical protein BN36_NA76730 [Leishmania guyanensis]